LPALTFQSEQAREMMQQLGYPGYFLIMLTVFKVGGALALAIPLVSPTIKEWAYAGFGFDFIAAAVSNWAVKGFGVDVIFCFVALAILIISWIYHHKMMENVLLK
jgi:hypothetical protein